VDVDEILEDHGLTRDNALAYIDAITRMNQSQAAEEINVSTDTIHRYKREFSRMDEHDRALVIATLFHEKRMQ